MESKPERSEEGSIPGGCVGGLRNPPSRVNSGPSYTLSCKKIAANKYRVDIWFEDILKTRLFTRIEDGVYSCGKAYVEACRDLGYGFDGKDEFIAYAGVALNRFMNEQH